MKKQDLAAAGKRKVRGNPYKLCFVINKNPQEPVKCWICILMHDSTVFCAWIISVERCYSFRRCCEWKGDLLDWMSGTFRGSHWGMHSADLQSMEPVCS